MKNSLKKYILGIFILIGILFIPSTVSALDLKLTYDKEINKCLRFVSVLPSYDNNGNIDGYLYSHDYGIMKMNLNNEIVYEDKESDASDNVNVETIDSSNSDAYVVRGETDLLIRAVDDDGNILFTKQFGGNGIEEEIGTINSYDDNGILDGYLVVFITLSSDLGIEPGCGMVKFDLKGNVRWIKCINKYFTMDGLLYSNNNQLFVFETDSKEISKYNIFDDQLVFEKDTGIYISNINYSYNKNGIIDGVVVVGYLRDNETYDDYGTLIKYDLDGNEIFRVQYDKNNVDSVYIDVISSYLPDGSYDGYIVTGVSYCAIVNDIQCTDKTFLVKYDFSGNKVFEKTYSKNSSIEFKLVDNYDSTGRQNGYLLYEENLPSLERKLDNVDTYIKVNCSYQIVKYTYDIFPVTKEENNGGTITVKSDALPGELVKVNVLVKEGYSLQRIIVKDENGKEIEVNSDGTFVMPEGKVTVSAIYKRLTNPDTVSAAYMVLGVILVVSVGSMIVIKKRNDM